MGSFLGLFAFDGGFGTGKQLACFSSSTGDKRPAEAHDC